jgi:hypothetical protein
MWLNNPDRQVQSIILLSSAFRRIYGSFLGRDRSIHKFESNNYDARGPAILAWAYACIKRNAHSHAASAQPKV